MSDKKPTELVKRYALHVDLEVGWSGLFTSEALAVRYAQEWELKRAYVVPVYVIENDANFFTVH